MLHLRITFDNFADVSRSALFSSFVMLSYPSVFTFFSSLIADRISFRVGFSVFIGSTSNSSVSISADASGSDLLRTSLKCSFQRHFTSFSFVRSAPYFVFYMFNLCCLTFAEFVSDSKDCFHISYIGFCLGFGCKTFKPLLLVFSLFFTPLSLVL